MCLFFLGILTWSESRLRVQMANSKLTKTICTFQLLVMKQSEIKMWASSVGNCVLICSGDNVAERLWWGVLSRVFLTVSSPSPFIYLCMQLYWLRFIIQHISLPWLFFLYFLTFLFCLISYFESRMIFL